MFPKVIRAAIALTSTALIIPYAIAFITELLYGRSSKSYIRYLRSLHPYRVYALNLALLSKLTRIKYAKLYLKWTKHYKNLSYDRAIKDIEYGQNKNSLDIYKPLSTKGTLEEYRLKPIVVFIYGGTWGSGDKNMYSLLCSHLADNFNCLVVCPNYSIYPKGFVDDMVQDISDVLHWLNSTAILYDGDKTRISLVGHSAGAHIAALTVLELSLKYVNSLPEFVTFGRGETDELPLEISFLEESTFVREEFGSRKLPSTQRIPVKVVEKEPISSDDKDWMKIGVASNNDGDLEGNIAEGSVGESFIVLEACDDDNNKNVEDLSTSLAKVDVEMLEQSIPVSPQPMAIETRRAKGEENLLSFIKVVIGLGGAYNIKKHYEHEVARGIENYSTMSKAMYDDENNFDNFSPEVVLKNLPPHIRLPAFHLVHGNTDETVPPNSSLSFAEALWKRDSRNVHMTMLVGCNHIDVCLDMMDEERRWYGAVMNEMKKAFNRFFF